MPDSRLARSEANAHGGVVQERGTQAREGEGDGHDAATAEHEVGGAVSRHTLPERQPHEQATNNAHALALCGAPPPRSLPISESRCEM